MPPKPKKSKAKAPGKSVPHGEEFDAPFVPVFVNPVKVDVRADVEALAVRVQELEKPKPLMVVDFDAMADRVAELESDLIRIVELIVKGDIDSVKFKEILSKRQGKA